MFFIFFLREIQNQFWLFTNNAHERVFLVSILFEFIRYSWSNNSLWHNIQITIPYMVLVVLVFLIPFSSYRVNSTQWPLHSFPPLTMLLKLPSVTTKPRFTHHNRLSFFLLFWFIPHGFQQLPFKYYICNDFYYCSADSTWKIEQSKQLLFLDSCCELWFQGQGQDNHSTIQAKYIPSIDQAQWKQIDVSFCSIL